MSDHVGWLQNLVEQRRLTFNEHKDASVVFDVLSARGEALTSCIDVRGMVRHVSVLSYVSGRVEGRSWP